MSWKVLVTAPYMLPVIDRFADELAGRGVAYETADVDERMEEADLIPIIGGYDGIICGDDRITERVLDAAPRLRVIAKWGTGIDSIDAESARARGIRVCRTLDAFTEPVADSVLGYILAFARNIAAMDRQMKADIWDKIPGRALNECSVGVVGVGAIGSAVLRRARVCGAGLLGTDIRDIHPGHVKALGVSMVTFDEVLTGADFVVVSCDLNPTSQGLINAEAFFRMRDDAVMINCARGPIVDEAALIEALRSGAIAGAALDVFEHEPLPADSPLRQMDNVLLAPHNSNSSPSAWERIHWSTINQLIDGLTASA